MPYFAKLIDPKVKTYDSQGVVFKQGDPEKEISKRLYNHLKHRTHIFETREEAEKPKSLSEMNREELNAYAEMAGVEAPEEFKNMEALRKAIKEREQEGA